MSASAPIRVLAKAAADTPTVRRERSEAPPHGPPKVDPSLEKDLVQEHQRQGHHAVDEARRVQVASEPNEQSEGGGGPPWASRDGAPGAS